jgi:hypothetical protein
MRELFDSLCELFPFLLLFLLPVFIILAPEPVVAASDITGHRLSHYDLGGSSYGAKIASLNMEARDITAKHVLRKVVVAKIKDVSVSEYNNLASLGAGGLLLLLPPPPPPSNGSYSAAAAESVLALEDHLASGEMELPVYFAEENEKTLELLDALQGTGSEEKGKQGTATQAILDGVISNGYQLVTSITAAPKQIPDQTLINLQGNLLGKAANQGEEYTLPTILVVAHYDAAAASPSLAFGADSNGSGLTMIMELARIWNLMYRSKKTQPAYNLVFLLSGGGKINFLGSKKWIDDLNEDGEGGRQQEEDLSSFEIMKHQVRYVVCLDSLGLGNTLYAHVSKPPKESSHAHKFIEDLKKTGC